VKLIPTKIKKKLNGNNSSLKQLKRVLELNFNLPLHFLKPLVEPVSPQGKKKLAKET